MRVEAGNTLLVEGPCKARVSGGLFDVFGKIHGPGDEIMIPGGKVYPLFARESGEISLLGPCKHKLVEGDPFPTDWREAIESIAGGFAKGETLMVLGYCDVGKSTFILMVANKLIAKGLKVGIIDLDIGQAKIGTPGILAAGLVREQITSLEEVEPEYLYFIGDNTPTGHLLQIATGAEKLVAELRRKADAVLVDTTGMVFGGPARALKLSKISLIEPDYIVLLEKANELEHFYRVLEGYPGKLYRVRSPRTIRSTPRETRIGLRHVRAKKFLRLEQELDIPLSGVAIRYSLLRSGIPLPNPEGLLCPGVLYAELAPDVLIVVAEKREPELIERARRLLTALKAAYYAIRMGIPLPGGQGASQKLAGLSSEDIVRLGALLVSQNPSDIRVQVIKPDYYSGLLAGLSDERDFLLGVGVIKSIDFKAGRVRVRARMLREGRIRKLWIGYLRYNENLEEIGRRRVDVG